MSKAKVIAFYLPQFHPCEDNDRWWGKGFTEWSNVGKAHAMYPGHNQPKVPTELGYYDLRLSEVREAQAQLARDAGVDCFCYWHYWMGGGKQLLERPLQEVLSLGKPNFPFCLAWANHSWLKKSWNSKVSYFNTDMLLKQSYPGKEDIDNHFYAMLPAFKDKRYYKIHGKLLFVIYAPKDIPDLDYFISRWNDLADKNALPGFYFVGHADYDKYTEGTFKKCDAVVISYLGKFFVKSKIRKAISLFLRIPKIVNYKQILKIDLSIFKSDYVYPSIYPNWDNTPRIGPMGTVLHNSKPSIFKMHVREVLDAIKDKSEDDRIVFLKSWNEWAEGNYMEPDIKYGRGYIEALREALEE